MLLALTTRRMVRSAHLVLSHIRFTAQLHLAVSDRYSYDKIHTYYTSLLGTATWAHLSTSHHIRPSPKGSGLMRRICICASLVVKYQDAVLDQILLETYYL